MQLLDSCSGSAINNADIDAYSKHLQELKADMEVQFQDVFQFEVLDWIINPFCDIISENGILEKELITSKSDLELKPKFKILYQLFWLQNKIKGKILSCVGSSQTFSDCHFQLLVEHAFSAVIMLLESKRNCLEIVNCGD